MADYTLASGVKALKGSWRTLIQQQLTEPYMQSLAQTLQQRAALGATILPPAKDVFHAFETLPLEDIKVIVLGQDPYHGVGQAHGLSFSVPHGVKVPPSLGNIYKELVTDVDCSIAQHGCLDQWAEQGVLLLNNVLTVEQGEAASHRKLGWEQFTDHIIATINQRCEGVVFMLWGAPAQHKATKVDRQKHCVLKAPHPSPLSAYRGFFGCRHFSQANTYLLGRGHKPINWQL